MILGVIGVMTSALPRGRLWEEPGIIDCAGGNATCGGAVGVGNDDTCKLPLGIVLFEDIVFSLDGHGFGLITCKSLL